MDKQSKKKLNLDDSIDNERDFKFLLNKKTRIVCTVTHNTTLNGDLILKETLSNYIKKGMNIIRCHMGYQDKKFIRDLYKMRKKLEAEFDINIPLMMDLPGYSVRLGTLSSPEIHIKKGQEFRIFTKNPELMGSANFVNCELKHWFDELHLGDKILLDYGRNFLIVKGKESYSEAMKNIEQVGSSFTEIKKAPNQTSDTVIKRRNSFKIQNTTVEDESPANTNHSTTMTDFDKIKQSINEKGLDQILSPQVQHRKCGLDGRTSSFAGSGYLSDKKPGQQDDNMSNASRNSRGNVFRNKYKGEKEVRNDVKSVIVCQVMQNFIIRSHAPVQIEVKKVKQAALKVTDEVSNVISSSDINFIDAALQNEVDFITVSCVRSSNDLTEVRQMIRRSPNTKLICKIESPDALHDIDQLIKQSDGIMITRDSLTNLMMDVYNADVQQQIIDACKRNGKSVFIKGQIFESMLTSALPTCSEINDVISLVNDEVDGLVIVRETMYSSQALDCVEAMSKLCITSEERYMQKSYSVPFQPVEMDQGQLLNGDMIAKATLSACVATACRIQDIKAVFCITQTGATIKYLTSYNIPCPVLALCKDSKVARSCLIHKGVVAYDIGSLLGLEKVIEKGVDYMMKKCALEKGDTICVLMGNIDNSQQTNTIKIIKI